MVGSTISAYINGALIVSGTDTTFTTGNPGIGFNFGCANTYSAFGFSSFTATDGTTQTGPNFTISTAPASLTAVAGTNANYSASVTPSGGFNGIVGLSVRGAPQGATASFSPPSITASGSSTLTVNTPGTTPATGYQLIITGTSGSLNQTANATLVVSSPNGAISFCDLNKDGAINVMDVQSAVNSYTACTSGPNVSNPTFVSQVLSAALGESCAVTTGAHTASLSWKSSATSGVTYNVYRAATSGAYNYTTPLNSTPIAGTSFSDCTVLPGQTYYYVARAANSTGNSVNSNEVQTIVPTP
jgi:hypothetical protein